MRKAGFKSKDFGDWNLVRGGLFRDFTQRINRGVGVDVNYHRQRGAQCYAEASKIDNWHYETLFRNLSSSFGEIMDGLYDASPYFFQNILKLRTKHILHDNCRS